jgi:hypothetical protein
MMCWAASDRSTFFCATSGKLYIIMYVCECECECECKYECECECECVKKMVFWPTQETKTPFFPPSPAAAAADRGG